jgi:protocatechuate 3,4-dioxygenase beta subunit
LCLLLLPMASFAQIGASGITGTVTDSAGAAVPHAKITATNEATNVSASTITSTGGTYEIRNLIPGTYNVTAEVSGFKTNVTLHVVT